MRGVGRAAWALLCALALPGGHGGVRAAAVDGGATYPITWSDINPTADQVATDPAADRTEFGSCVCDRTFLACDYNCACDPLCTPDDLEVFSGNDPEGPRPLVVRRCVDSELVEANERGGLTTTLVDNLLCVERVNNDEREYFVDPGVPTAAEVSTALAARDFSFRPERVAEADDRDYYLVDDAVRGGADSGGTAYPVYAGLMPLPVAGFGGECSDRSALRFMRDADAGAGARCTRYTTALDTDCAAEFGFARYVSELRVRASPTGAYVTPVLDGAVRRDAATGAETAVAAGDLAALATAFVSATSTCTDALAELRYSVQFTVQSSEPGAVVSRVGVTLVLTDVVASAAGGARHRQQFTAEFVPVSPDALERPKSGAPGYELGAPVVAGTLRTQDDKSAVEQCEGGLQVLPRTAAGVCDAAFAAGSSAATVRAGVDGAFSCALQLTEAELRSECSDPVLLRALFGPAFTHVASFGGADFANTKDWTAVDGLGTEVAAGTYDNTMRRCTLSNALNLEFVTADVGSKENPQRKIVGARASLSTSGPWDFPAADGSGTAPFAVTVTATFAHLQDQALESFTPSAPPVLPRLPRDVLYPLYIDEE